MRDIPVTWKTREPVKIDEDHPDFDADLSLSAVNANVQVVRIIAMNSDDSSREEEEE